MALSKEEVRHIAALARIGLSDEDLDRFSGDLGAILDWVKQLDEADASNAAPTAHVVGTDNVSDEDAVAGFDNREGLKALFPEERDGYDQVRSVF